MSDDRDDGPCGACACEGADGSPSRRSFLQLAAGITLSALVVTTAEAMQAGSERRYPVPATDGVTIDKTNQVILVRYQAHLYAFNLACPHQNQALRWLPKDNRFQCPKHDSKYQPNGTFMNGRATRNMDRLAVRLDGATLVVNLSTMFQSDKDAAGWAAAMVAI